MSVDKHREAEKEMGEADAAATAGDFATAAVHLAMAGLHENDALELVPGDRQRTRGVLAMSVVWCYRHASEHAGKAGETNACNSYRDVAVLYARKYLGETPVHLEPPLDSATQAELRQIIAELAQ